MNQNLPISTYWRRRYINRGIAILVMVAISMFIVNPLIDFLINKF